MTAARWTDRLWRGAPHPPPAIQTTASPEQLAQLFARIRQSWTALGAARPHFSVLAEDEFLPGNLADSGERFWASGEAEAELVVAALARHGFAAPARKRCLEYGCGVGRVTLPLAGHFADLDAYDISGSHIELARRRAAEAGVGNVRFHNCGEALPSRLARCDFFYSRLVFQHNPPPLMRHLVALALASLDTGGIAIFGLPTCLPGYRFRTAEYLARAPRTRMEMHCLPRTEVMALIAEAGCAVIEVREERKASRDGESLSHVFVVERPRTGTPANG